MSWIIRVPGFELDSDDMSIADLGKVEKMSGEPWSTSNPFRDIAVAKAFYFIALERSGMSKVDVDARISELTLKDMKAAFEWRDDDEEEEHEEVDPSDLPQNSTTPD